DPLQYSMICGLQGVTSFDGLRLDGSWVHGAVAADAEGLRFVHRTGMTTGSLVVDSAPIAGATWARARSLVAVDLDGDGDEDIVGLDATGTQLLQLTNAGFGVTESVTWVPAPPIDLGMELAGLDVADLAGLPAFVGLVPDAAGDAVAAFDADGELLLLASVGGRAADLTVLRDGTGDDSFALLIGARVTVMDAAGQLEPGVELGLDAPTAISAADVDGDGRQDVLANSTAAGAVTALLRVAGTAYSLDAASQMRFDLGAPDADWSMQRSAPVGADFDDDGDIDVLQFVDSDRTVALRRSGRIDETVCQAELLDSAWNITPTGNSADLWVTVPQFADGTTPDLLEVMLTSNPADPATGDPRHRFMTTQVADVSDVGVGDIAHVSVQWSGDLGTEASVSFRPLGVDSTGLYVDRTGVELAYVYAGTGAGAGRGTDNPIELPPTPGPVPPSTVPPPALLDVAVPIDVQPQ
ncbi:MAG: hypothetical protein AAFZ87_09555, partial [Planctomycetota bacterium]